MQPETTTQDQRVALPFAAIVLAMLPSVLDQTILATALPTVAADLGRLSDISWVVTAYVVAAAATTPLWGKLGDRHGRKRLLALLGLGLRLPATATDGPGKPLDALGAVLLAGATSALMLVCVWGGDRYAWGSATIVGLIAATLLRGGALLVREPRAADPIVPLQMLRRPAVAVASVALFLATAALFAITVFVPLFLQATTGASPTRAGLLLVPMMLGVTLSTTLSGRSIARTGRYKRFPVAGLALMTLALGLLAALADDHSRTATGIGLAIFGVGFGMVTQVLVVAVQNSVERRELGVATAVTGFFRALGGAVGAAVLGAVFTARVGAHPPVEEIADGVQAVFMVAAPLAGLALLAVLRLPELPLKAKHG